MRLIIIYLVFGCELSILYLFFYYEVSIGIIFYNIDKIIEILGGLLICCKLQNQEEMGLRIELKLLFNIEVVVRR